MINCCVYGVPLPPYIKEQGGEAAGQEEARQGGVLLGVPVLVGFHLVEGGRRKGEGEGKERGAPPPSPSPIRTA